MLSFHIVLSDQKQKCQVKKFENLNRWYASIDLYAIHNPFLRKKLEKMGLFFSSTQVAFVANLLVAPSWQSSGMGECLELERIDFFRNSIRSVKPCFLAPSTPNFSAMCIHMAKKLGGESAQKSLVSPTKANFERSLISSQQRRKVIRIVRIRSTNYQESLKAPSTTL